MQQDESGRDDRTDAPRAETDVAKGLERGLEQRVSAFTDGTFPVVGLVVRFLIVGQVTTLGFLDCDGDRAGLAFIPQITQNGPLVAGPGDQRGKDLGVCAQGCGVVLVLAVPERSTVASRPVR